MLVNLKTDSLMIFSYDSYYLKKYQDNIYETRNVLVGFIKNKGITTYDSFLKLINAVAPLEDEIEIYRFWHGYFFSEYFVDFIMDLINKFPFIDLTPFQDKIQCKCKACGSIVLTDKIVRNERRNKSR